MCNCGNYCPHCGQLKAQPYQYPYFPYQNWQGQGGYVPVTNAVPQTGACNTTEQVDVLGNNKRYG